jgi:hypothetical protein
MALKQFAFALIAAAAAGPAAAQTAAPPTTEELVVTGQRVDEAVRNFVAELSAPPPSEDQLARWNNEVCVGAIGIRARYGQFIVDRIAQRADAVGLRSGGPGCRANVVVFVTPDSDVLARELVTQFRSLVGATGQDNTNTQGSDALEAFASTHRPVRWWHVSNTVTADGQVLADVPGRMVGGQLTGQVVRTTSAGFGRLARTTRQDFSRVVIIVDAREAAGQQLSALADYLAMVALAQIAQNADASAVPSILNLFSANASARTVEMTEWDKAYLEGLYEAPRTARNADQQESAIERTMREELSEPQN